MTSPNTISVIIPHYNGGRFIGRAVKSVLSQTYHAHEVIVVDDGSAVSSKNELKTFMSEDNVTVLFHESNRGIPAARNTGIKNSSGRFIAFLDQDDFWREEKLAKQIAVFAGGMAEDVGLVFSDITIADDQEQAIRQKSARIPNGFNNHSRVEMLREYFTCNFISIVSSMIRRECFDTVGLLNEEIIFGGDDYEFILRLLTTYKAHAIDEALAVRTMHGANFTNAAKMLPEVIDVIEELAARVPDVNDLLNSRKSGLWCDIGAYYMRIGDSAQAKRCFHEALKFSPGTAKAYLGVLSSRSGALGRGLAGAWYFMRDKNSRSKR